MRRMLLSFVALATMLALPARSFADLIDFDAQASGQSSYFNGDVDSPLTIGIATFTGGELLTGETYSPGGDSTGVYATSNLFANPTAYADPLTIQFSQPVSNFSIEVVNGYQGSDTVSLSDGASETLSGDYLTTIAFSFTDTGITSATILGAVSSLSYWDFAIDDVTFTPSLATPEPSAMILAAAGGLAMIGYGRKRRRGSAAASAEPAGAGRRGRHGEG